MSLVMPAKGADFELTPAGSHVATCYRIVDLGTQETTYQGVVSHKHQILISWELPEELMKDGRPFTAHKSYTYSSSPKANLRRDLESWRGQKFNDADFGTFDLSRLLGAGCMLNVVHDHKDENTYANIAAIMALPKGVVKTGRATQNEMLIFSLSDRPFDHEAWGKLSENLQNRIKRAPEYSDAVDDRPAPRESDYGSRHDLDDEIPF